MEIILGGIRMSDLFSGIKEQLSGQNMKIVFPEGLDERVLAAAGRLAERSSVNTYFSWKYRAN